MLESGYLAPAPSAGQGSDNGGNHAGADDTNGKNDFPLGSSEIRDECVGQLLDGIEWGIGIVDPDGRGRRDQNGGHDGLGYDRSNGGVPAGGRIVFRMQAFVGDGGLLVKDHPRHDHRTDIGGNQHHVVGVAERSLCQPGQHGLQMGMADPGDSEEDQLKGAHGQRDSFYPSVGPGPYDHQQGGCGQTNPEEAWFAKELTYPSNSRKFR